MSGENKKWVVILIGPPGSGKGTQADLLAERFNLVHIETSKLGIQKINNPDFKDDPETRRVKELYDMGELFPPPWTAKLIIEKVSEEATKNQGVVFSGTPRSLYEIEKELPVFEELFGKNNIKVINLEISEHISTERSLGRRICKSNSHPIPNFPEFNGLKVCPQDGSEIVVKSLDKPETIKTRNEIYHKQTKPVLDFLRKKGYRIIEINGEQLIEKVFSDILDKLND